MSATPSPGSFPPPSGTAQPHLPPAPPVPGTPLPQAPLPPGAAPASSADDDPPICSRHPNREAWRRCSRCGKRACSECLVQAAVGSHCRDCAKAGQPSAATRLRWWNARQLTLVTTTLMALNIAIFVLTVVVSDRHAATGRGRATDLQYQYGLAKVLLAADHRWIRLLSNGFFHFGIIHLAVNMFSLFMLGSGTERALGRGRFAALYFAALFAGSLGVMLVGGNSLNAGASGAIFGLLGALAVGQLRRGGSLLGTQLGTVLMLNLVLTFRVHGISIGGHLGGLAGGALVGLAIFPPPGRRLPPWATYAAALAVAAVSIAISVIVALNTDLRPFIPIG